MNRIESKKKNVLSTLKVLSLIFLLFSCTDSNLSDKGDEYFNNGHYKKAIESYNKYLEVNPVNEDVLYNKGRAYEELENYEKAVENYKKVLDKSPRNVEALTSLGQCLYKIENYETAAEKLKSALRENENIPSAHYMLGTCYYKMQKKQLAMRHLNKAISLKSDYGVAYIRRGIVKLSKDNKEGCDDLKTAIKLGEKHASEILNEYCK